MEVVQREDGTYYHGTTVEIDDESPQTCSFEEGTARYARASRVLKAIREKFDTFKPPPMRLPEIEDICRKNYAISCFHTLGDGSLSLEHAEASDYHWLQQSA
jgi:hypothetical protein